MWPFASFDAPTPSRGMPMKFLSSLPFEFSSCTTDTAYVPGAIPVKSQTAWRSAILAVSRATALSAFVGNASADENSAHRPAPCRCAVR